MSLGIPNFGTPLPSLGVKKYTYLGIYRGVIYMNKAISVRKSLNPNAHRTYCVCPAEPSEFDNWWRILTWYPRQRRRIVEKHMKAKQERMEAERAAKEAEYQKELARQQEIQRQQYQAQEEERLRKEEKEKETKRLRARALKKLEKRRQVMEKTQERRDAAEKNDPYASHALNAWRSGQ